MTLMQLQLAPDEISQEAHHRFMNTLTTLQGLLRRHLGAFSDPAVKDAVAVFGSQLEAFAAVHRSLMAVPADGWVDVRDYFGGLCEHLCAAYLEPRGVACEFRCDPGSLPRDVCQTLGLLIVELTTNAAKHAFAGRSSGRVTIALRRVAKGWLCVVADDGVGFQAERPGRGTTLVRSLVRAMGGRLSVYSSSSGVMSCIELPHLPHAAPRHGDAEEGVSAWAENALKFEEEPQHAPSSPLDAGAV